MARGATVTTSDSGVDRSEHNVNNNPHDRHDRNRGANHAQTYHDSQPDPNVIPVYFTGVPPTKRLLEQRELTAAVLVLLAGFVMAIVALAVAGWTFATTPHEWNIVEDREAQFTLSVVTSAFVIAGLVFAFLASFASVIWFVLWMSGRKADKQRVLYKALLILYALTFLAFIIAFGTGLALFVLRAVETDQEVALELLFGDRLYDNRNFVAFWGALFAAVLAAIFFGLVWTAERTSRIRNGEQFVYVDCYEVARLEELRALEEEREEIRDYERRRIERHRHRHPGPQVIHVGAEDTYHHGFTPRGGHHHHHKHSHHPRDYPREPAPAHRIAYPATGGAHGGGVAYPAATGAASRMDPFRNYPAAAGATNVLPNTNLEDERFHRAQAHMEGEPYNFNTISDRDYGPYPSVRYPHDSAYGIPHSYHSHHREHGAHAHHETRPAPPRLQHRPEDHPEDELFGRDPASEHPYK